MLVPATMSMTGSMPLTAELKLVIFDAVWVCEVKA